MVSFEAIYNQYGAQVKREIGRRLTGADTADLFQDVFLKILKGLPNYRGEASALGGWIHRITINTILNHYRHYRAENNRVPAVSIDGNPSNLSQEDLGLTIEVIKDPTSQTPEEQVLLNEEMREVKERIRALPSLTQSYLRLSALGFSYQEIAQRYQTTVCGVKTRLTRGRKKLR